VGLTAEAKGVKRPIAATTVWMEEESFIFRGGCRAGFWVLELVVE
jgi:hypothetical protein